VDLADVATDVAALAVAVAVRRGLAQDQRTANATTAAATSAGTGTVVIQLQYNDAHRLLQQSRGPHGHQHKTLQGARWEISADGCRMIHKIIRLRVKIHYRGDVLMNKVCREGSTGAAKLSKYFDRRLAVPSLVFCLPA
jgi:hypothetical protein